MKKRTPYEVAEAIKKIVPMEYKERFRKLCYSFAYKAPEQNRECWSLLQMELTKVVGDPPLTVDWKIKAVSIMMDKSDIEINKMFGWPRK